MLKSRNKIQDASDGSEDGLLEFANKKQDQIQSLLD